MEATVCCQFYYWSGIEVVPTKFVVQSAYTSAIERSLLKWKWAWLRRFNALQSWVLLLSCDYILKFDWYCQLSGSGSNSLNSWKLLGRFSYGLGMRLDSGFYIQHCGHIASLVLLDPMAMEGVRDMTNGYGVSSLSNYCDVNNRVITIANVRIATLKLLYLICS